jgi:hypothetical protein
LDEQGSGRHPVGVEITVDGNRLSLSESLAEAGDGLVHALETKGVILWPITFQESLDLGGCAKVPVIEQLNDERREAREVSRIVRRWRRCYLPSLEFYGQRLSSIGEGNLALFLPAIIDHLAQNSKRSPKATSESPSPRFEGRGFRPRLSL